MERSFYVSYQGVKLEQYFLPKISNYLNSGPSFGLSTYFLENVIASGEGCCSRQKGGVSSR